MESYFVSYAVKAVGRSGYGNHQTEWAPIRSVFDLMGIAREIEKERNLPERSVVVLFYQKLESKEKQERER